MDLRMQALEKRDGENANNADEDLEIEADELEPDF